MAASAETETQARAAPVEKSLNGFSGLISPRVIVRISWEGVLRNKVRSLLTMLGIIIGVAAVIIMISISAGTEAQIAEQIEGLGANLVFVQASFGRGGLGSSSNQPTLIYDDTAVVESVGGVVGTVVEQPASETVKVDGVALTDVTIVGTTADFPSVRAVPVADGHFFNETEVDRAAKVVVLGASLVNDLFGDVDPIGKSVTFGNTKLSVIGVFFGYFPANKAAQLDPIEALRYE